MLDTLRLTLYKTDGTTMTIPQGDPRVATIVAQLQQTPPTPDNPVEVDVTEAPRPKTVYEQFMEANPGIVEFVRVGKALLEQLEELHKATANTEAAVTPGVFGSTDAISQIMANAKPIAEAAKDTTVVAVMGGTYVPGMENLTEQLKASMNEDSTNMKNFLKRLKAVAEKRLHSAEDLLKFLQRGDLPIAVDGSIIAYKILRRSDDAYVDCHTGKVTQAVGDFVCMDESLVDSNRRHECSNGLHVARRQYISNFSGDVVTLIKIAPEDVIAVPSYDANKMRVCGYHILAEISHDGYGRLLNDQPIVGTPDEQLLFKALNNLYPAPVRQVKIGEHLGGRVTITPLEQPKPAMEPEKETTSATKTTAKVKAKALSESKDSAATRPAAPKVEVKTVAKSSASGSKTLAEKAAELYKAFTKGKVKDGSKKAAAQALMDLKRASKKSWDYLGITETEVALLKRAVD